MSILIIFASAVAMLIANLITGSLLVSTLVGILLLLFLGGLYMALKLVDSPTAAEIRRVTPLIRRANGGDMRAQTYLENLYHHRRSKILRPVIAVKGDGSLYTTYCVQASAWINAVLGR